MVSKTSNAQSYDDFLGDLPENDCRYAVYDFEYDTSDSGKRSKIVFFTWSPDTAPIRVCWFTILPLRYKNANNCLFFSFLQSKMVYASSKEALRRALSGVSTEIQGTDFSEVAFESVLERVSRGAGSH